MANKKISNLDALGGTPAVGDLLPVVDISDTTQGLAGSTKKMTVAELGAAITPDFSAIAEDIVPDADSTRDLGTTAKRWAEIWGDNIEATTDITIGGVASTGTGGLARATSPTFVTPTLGVASATSINLGDTTLSNYDEGTWTPVIADDKSAGNVSATSAASAKYTRIGRQVFITCAFSDISTAGMTAGNDFFIRGLPFTAGGMPGTYFYTGSMNHNGLTYVGDLRPGVIDNTSYIRLMENVSGTSSDYLLVSQVASGTADIYIGLTYII